LAIGDSSGGDVSRKLFAFGIVALAAVAFASPLHAQETAKVASNPDIIKWAIITAGFALAIAAAFGALGQSRAIGAAVEGIARNPSAAGEIRGNLILGLVLIESLVIYVLLVSLILFFVYGYTK
jgi:F-type H+-transporting ATPase subunit c